MKITVAGVGYVGLSLAALLAQKHEVTAITTTEKKADKLNQFFLLCAIEHNRKNWLFCTAVKGADASAAAYSIIETARANGLDCRKYLTYLFEKLSQLDFRSDPSLFEKYLPWTPEIQENCK